MASSTSNVWVVDDDRSIRWVLERALEQAGMTTMSFDSGDAMLQRLTREQPDVIISDIRMPGIDGIGSARARASTTCRSCRSSS